MCIISATLRCPGCKLIVDTSRVNSETSFFKHQVLRSAHACGLSMQVWNPECGEEEVLVMVCRTGLNTVMGKIIRDLLAPPTVSQEKNPVVVVGSQSQHVLVLEALNHTDTPQNDKV